jgi:hypothetical protein
MAPKRVVKTLAANWDHVEFSLLQAMAREKDFARWSPPLETNEIVRIFSPEALRDLSEDGEGDYDYHESIRVEYVSDLPKMMVDYEQGRPLVGEFYRYLLMQLRYSCGL